MTTLRHDLSGPDGAQVLVLGNSMGTTTQVWDAQVPAFREHFRVLRYELPGHGGSPAPPGPYTMAGLGGDVRDLLDALVVVPGAHLAAVESPGEVTAALLDHLVTSPRPAGRTG